MKKLLLLLIISPIIMFGQEVKYDYFKIENENLVFDRVYQTIPDCINVLDRQLSTMRGVENYVRKDSLITFRVYRIKPEENEISKIKQIDKNFSVLRVHAFSFSAAIYFKGDRYRVVLTNIMDCIDLDSPPGKLMEATYGLYSPKNKKFRKWSSDYGHTMENYFNYLFTLNKSLVEKSDW